MLSGLGKTFSRIAAGVEDTFRGPNYLRRLGHLIEDNKADEAMDLYLEILADNTFDMMQVNPSVPYSYIANPAQDTFLHMAASRGMLALVRIFLEKGGNPNVTNTRSATAIHALCSSTNPSNRIGVLDYIESWHKGYIEAGLTSEAIAINHLDVDGNSPIHLAASNGLLGCVKKLVEMDSNLSIVNKIQLTCCELAFESNYINMSDMLELALLFPLAEDGDIYDVGNNPVIERQNSIMFANNKSLQSDADVGEYIESTIQYLISTFAEIDLSRGTVDTTITYEKVELLLNAYDWDVRKLLHVYLTDKKQMFPLIISTDSTADGAYHSMSCVVCSDDMSSTPLVYAPKAAPLADELKPSIKCNFGHQFCKDCWAQNSCSLVDNEGSYILSCPGYRCKQILDHKEFGRYLLCEESNSSSSNVSMAGKNRYDKFLDLRRKHVVSLYSQAWKYCPCTNCSSIILCEPANSNTSPSNSRNSVYFVNLSAHTPSFDGANSAASSFKSSVAAGGGSSSSTPINLGGNMNKTAICSNFHSICMLCQGSAHTLITCSQWDRWKKTVTKRIGTLDVATSSSSAANAANQMADQLWLAANTKPCPSCQSAIEKNDGCNHMTCRKCRHEFCWICMQKWSLHSQKTGGSFQCNMALNTSQLSSKMDDEDDELLKDLAVDVKGNAKADNARFKLIQQNTTIFISYFTRVKAHDDSLKMEISRMPETIKRVSKCLVDSFYSLPDPKNIALKGEVCSTSESAAKKIKVEAVKVGGFDIKDKNNSHKAVVWLQGERVTHPIANYIAREEFSIGAGGVDLFQYRSNLSAQHLNKVIAKECLQFLTDGFIELIKCRETLKGIAMYSYFTFGKLSLTETSEAAKLTPFKSILKQSPSPTSSSNRALMEQKTALERLTTELEKYTEMLSDVVARRRLRASRYIIVNMSTLAREKRIECEDCLLVHGRSLEPPSRPSGSSSSTSSSSRNKYDSDSDNDVMSAFDSIFSSILPGYRADRTGGGGGSGSYNTNTNSSSNNNTNSSSINNNNNNNNNNKPSKFPATSSTNSTISTALKRTSEEDEIERAIQLSLAEALPLNSGGSTTRCSNAHQPMSMAGDDDLDLAIIQSLAETTTSSSSISRTKTPSNFRSAPDILDMNTIDQSVATLVGMGFDRDQARRSLAQHDNNLDEALNALLSSI